METSDGRELARRAAGGDEGAWREIYDRTRELLFGLLSYQLGDREEARDVLQETYLSAYRSIGSFRGEGSLEGWLAKIALRRAADWKRKILVRLKRLVPIESARGIKARAPAEIPLRTESERIQIALMRLSERQRSVLLLRELNELSFADVARAVGCSEATARAHHRRARLRLQDSLAAVYAPSKAVCAEERAS